MVSILPTRTQSATLPDTNIAPANQWLEDDFPLGGHCPFLEATVDGSEIL